MTICFPQPFALTPLCLFQLSPFFVSSSPNPPRLSADLFRRISQLRFKACLLMGFAYVHLRFSFLLIRGNKFLDGFQIILVQSQTLYSSLPTVMLRILPLLFCSFSSPAATSITRWLGFTFASLIMISLMGNPSSPRNYT